MSSGDPNFHLVIMEHWLDPHSIEMNYCRTMSGDVAKVYVAQKLGTQGNAVRIPDLGHTNAMRGTEIAVSEDGAAGDHSENVKNEESWA